MQHVLCLDFGIDGLEASSVHLYVNKDITPDVAKHLNVVPGFSRVTD